jgi:uncharacterized protein (DUF1501 family)
MDRRGFLKMSGIAGTSLLMPNFLKAAGMKMIKFEGKILVVIQLSGGNDGLNTVVPFRNDDYYRLRPTISISESEVLKLNDSLGFNPALEGLKNIYDQGLLTVINNVGYPNPDRSHFRSMDIWHSGSSSNEFWYSGWLGRYLDAQCGNGKPAHSVLEIDDTLSLAVKGELKNALGVTSPKMLYDSVRSLNVVNNSQTGNDNLDYLYKTLADTKYSAEYLYDQSTIYSSSVTYPNTELGKHLKTISELIVSGCETSVYYCEHSGFDTHFGQLGKQKNLLSQYSEAVSAFVEDLKLNNKMNDVTIMTFSEFGRRVEQNASGGTDHGTANNVFIINGELKKPGVYNETPDLKNLDQGDLIYQIDFRNVYSTILRKVLKADDVAILKNNFSPLDFM